MLREIEIEDENQDNHICSTCGGIGIIGGVCGQTAETYEERTEPCPNCKPILDHADDETLNLSFERVRVAIIEGAWKGEKGWITCPKNELDANPITTDGGICLCWLDSEICIENTTTMQHPTRN